MQSHSGLCSTSMLVTNGELQCPVLGFLLVNIFTSDLWGITVYTLLKCTDDTKSGGKLLILLRVGSHPEGPEQAGRMMRQVTSEIKQGKMLSTATGKEEDLQWHRLWTGTLGAALQERSWGLKGSKLSLSQQGWPRATWLV